MNDVTDSIELEFELISDSSILLTWNDIEYDRYQVEYTTTLSFWPSDLHIEERTRRSNQIVITDELTAVFSDLTACHVYYFRVRGVNDNGTVSAVSNILAVQFNSLLPLNFQVIDNSDIYVTATWERPESVPAGITPSYTLEYSDIPNYWKSEDTSLEAEIDRLRNSITTKNTTAQIYILAPGKTFYFRIKTILPDKESIWSDVIRLTLTPTKSLFMSVVRQEGNRLMLSWDGMDLTTKRGDYQLTWSDNKEYFKIDDTTLSTEDRLVNTALFKTPPAVLELNKESDVYYFKVRTIVDDLTGPWSNETSVTIHSLFDADCAELPLGCKISRYDCDDIFSRILVAPRIVSGTRVEWRLSPRFKEPGPYQFTLEVGYAGVSDPAAWYRVAERIDVSYLIDTRQRVYGHDQFTHYRIRLESATGIYYSKPMDCFGWLSYNEWVRAQGIMDAEYTRLTRGEEGIPGWLFKRKWVGQKCPRCVDYQTQDSLNSRCVICYGTRFVGGFYEPIPCYYVNLNLYDREILVNYDANIGTESSKNLVGRAIADPMVVTGDIWVNARSDDRYYIHKVILSAAVQDVPLILNLELRHISYSDQVYDLKLPAN